MAAIAFRSTSQKSNSLFATVFSMIAAWNDARITRNALNQLSARELDDIGLVRGDIEAIANGALIR